MPVAAVVAGGVAAVVITLLVLNHRRQVRSPAQGLAVVFGACAFAR